MKKREENLLNVQHRPASLCEMRGCVEYPHVGAETNKRRMKGGLRKQSKQYIHRSSIPHAARATTDSPPSVSLGHDTIFRRQEVIGK